jgi:hypothetical protein
MAARKGPFRDVHGGWGGWVVVGALLSVKGRSSVKEIILIITKHFIILRNTSFYVRE